MTNHTEKDIAAAEDYRIRLAKTNTKRSLNEMTYADDDFLAGIAHGRAEERRLSLEYMLTHAKEQEENEAEIAQLTKERDLAIEHMNYDEQCRALAFAMLGECDCGYEKAMAELVAIAEGEKDG